MKTYALLFLTLLVIVSGCKHNLNQPKTVLPNATGSLKITGAYALYPLTRVWISEYQKLNPDIKFEVIANGSGGGLNDILNDRCNIAMISSEVPDELSSKLWITPVARLAVVLIINRNNPYLNEIESKGMKKDDISSIYMGNVPRQWKEIYNGSAAENINVLVRSDSSGASDVFAKYLWIKTTDLKGIGISGEDKMIEVVRRDPFALGYCNFIACIDPSKGEFLPGLAVVPIDFNHSGKLEQKEDFFDSVPRLQRAMWTGKYPCVMTRELYFVTKGKPVTTDILAFLKWVLTKGQEMIPKEGYIELHSSEIQVNLEALKN